MKKHFQQQNKAFCFTLRLVFLLTFLAINSAAGLAQDSPMPQPLEEGVLLDTTNLENYEEQVETEYESAFPLPDKNKIIKRHDFEEANWKKVIEGIDYVREKPKEKERKVNKPLASGDFGALGDIFKVVLWVFLISILVVILLYLFGTNLFGQRNKNVGDATVIDLEEIETNLEDSDLVTLLKKAIAGQQYKLAIRLYYLMVLKELSRKKFIEWRKDKTNRAYYYELSTTNPSNQNEFRKITQIFEKVWYGLGDFEQNDFYTIQPSFEEMLRKI